MLEKYKKWRFNYITNGIVEIFSEFGKIGVLYEEEIDIDVLDDIYNNASNLVEFLTANDIKSEEIPTGGVVFRNDNVYVVISAVGVIVHNTNINRCNDAIEYLKDFLKVNNMNKMVIE